jgi:hypothetical protein
MSDLHYCADGDHPIARHADTDALIPSALRFIAEVDTIIDVTLSLRPNGPDESPVTVRAVDSTFFEVDASAAILTSLRAPILKQYAADHSRNH